MWLKDLLPKSFPRARIMAYNHNSAWFRDAPVKSVRVCGEQLLEALGFYRKGAQVDPLNTIVFVWIFWRWITAQSQKHQN